MLFIISPNSAIFLLSRTSSNSKVFGILTTRTSNPFWATAAANVIYRTWLFFQVCLQHCISLEVKWISRDLNVSADYISKFVGFDDYVLWGPRTIDGFACSYNGKLPRFNCSILSARLRGSLISKLGLRQQQLALSSGLSHYRSHQAHEGVPSSGNPCSLPMEVSFFFWNAFNSNGVYWNSFVVNWVYLPKFQGLLFQQDLQFPFRIQAIRI